MKAREKLMRIAVVAVMLFLLFAVSDANTLKAEETTVVMGSTTLTNGYYYFDSASGGSLCQSAVVPEGCSDYMQYTDGVLTVYGSVTGTLYGGMQVSSGTLRLSGTGNLDVSFYGTLSGSGSLMTDGYTGNIALRSPVTTPVNGLSGLDLQTTGNIVIESSATSASGSAAAVKVGTLVLHGASVELKNNAAIEASGNATITATQGNLDFQAAFSNPLFLSNSPDATFTLNAPNGSVTIANSGTGSSLGVNGNLKVTAKNDVNISATLQAVNGSATIESQEGNVSIGSSNYTSVVSNKLTVRALNGAVCASGISASGGHLLGETDIQAKNKITIQDQGAGVSISGNASLTSTDDEIVILQNSSSPMVTGNLTLSTPKLTKMERITSSTNNLVGGTITSSDVIVLTNGSDTTYMSDGSATPTATCPHTRMDGTGTCIACSYQAPVAKVNGHEYTTLSAAISNAGNNDTIYLLMNYENSSLYLNFGNKDIIFNLQNHKLKADTVEAVNSLVIKNGELTADQLKTASVGIMTDLTLEDVEVAVNGFQWMSIGTVKFKNSSLLVDGTSAYLTTYVHRIEMDKTSRMEMNNPSGLSTYSSITVDAGKTIEDYGLYSIKNLLPKNSEIKAEINAYNVCTAMKIVDKNIQQPLQNLVLCYKNIADADVTVDASSIVYDGNAKKPTFTVKYGTEELEANVDFSTSYSGNTNAGRQAKITLTGNDVDSAYYGTKTIFFTIQKAPQAAPTGLVATAETIDGKNDGKIANLSVKMEYSVDNHTWIDANTQLLENLPDGDYYVRYKETNNYYASPSTKLVVAKGATPSTTGEQTTTERTTTTEKQTTVEETTTTGEQMTTERTTTTGEQATTQQTFVEQPDGATTQAGVPKTTESDKKTDKAVSTGDAYPIAIMITLLLGAGVGITGMIRRRKEK